MRGRGRGILVAGLSMVPALTACSGAGDGAADTGFRLDTIAGVPHAENAGEGLWAGEGGWRLDPGSAVEIGVIEGEEPYVFGGIAGVTVGADGRIYVADAQATEVRVYSAEGGFEGRFGRAGEGPGEFRNISGMGRGPDGGVAVLDGRLARVSVFDPDGEFVRSFGIERPYMILRRGAPVRFDDQGDSTTKRGSRTGSAPIRSGWSATMRAARSRTPRSWRSTSLLGSSYAGMAFRS